MNYSELVTAIQAYTENDETTFVSQIPNFVRQTEKRIYNSAQLPQFRKNSIGATTVADQYLQTPLDYLAPYSLALVNSDGEHEYLLNKDVNFIREAYPDETYTAKPKYYAQFDHNTFLLGPTPDVSYVMELHYYYYPESIVTASTTWLGDNYDTALLYGSLVEAYTFMKGEMELLAVYDKRYNEALAHIKQLGDAKNRMDAYRSGQLRIPVA
jgi:hypothetical protein